MRKLLITVVVLAALLLVADRVAVSVAEGQVATQMRTAGALDKDPRVDIRGFPFLTQALAGRYDEIGVGTTDYERSGVRLRSLDVVLRGSRIPLADAARGEVDAVPVEGLTADAVVAYVDLAGKSKVVGLRITPRGDEVELTGKVTVLGQTVSASARSRISLSGNRLVVRARSVKVLGQSSALLDRAVQRLLDVTVDVGRLPYGLRLTGVRVSPDGVRLEASTGSTVLDASLAR